MWSFKTTLAFSNIYHYSQWIHVLQEPLHTILLKLIKRKKHERYATQITRRRSLQDSYHAPNGDSKQYAKGISLLIVFVQQAESSLSILLTLFFSYLDWVIEYRAFRFNALTNILRLLIRRSVNERKQGIQKGIHVPSRIEQDSISNETWKNLVPSKLIVSFFLLIGWIIQLIFMKIKNLH